MQMNRTLPIQSLAGIRSAVTRLDLDSKLLELVLAKPRTIKELSKLLNRSEHIVSERLKSLGVDYVGKLAGSKQLLWGIKKEQNEEAINPGESEGTL